MKPIALLLALGLARVAVNAQTPTPATASASTNPTPPPVSAGVFNDWLRQQDPLFNDFDFGAQFRPRFVDQTYFAVPGAGPTAVDFRANTPQTYNDFLLLRTRVHGGYSPTDWFTVFGEGQNSSSTGDRRNPNTQSNGPFDLHQGYVRLGGNEEVPVSLKVGRQELIYGDERLIGAFDWDNIGRSFDAAKLRYEQKTFWVDAFVGRVLLPTTTRLTSPTGMIGFPGFTPRRARWCLRPSCNSTSWLTMRTPGPQVT